MSEIKELIKQIKRIADSLEAIETRGRDYISGSPNWMEKGVKKE